MKVPVPRFPLQSLSPSRSFPSFLSLVRSSSLGFLSRASIMEKNNDMTKVTSAVTKDVGDVENAGTRTHTKRGLSSRQIQFLALGMSTAVNHLIHN
jgi:amino acid permease